MSINISFYYAYISIKPSVRTGYVMYWNCTLNMNFTICFWKRFWCKIWRWNAIDID